MQVTLEQLEPCKVSLTVEVDAEDVNRALEKVFRDVAQRVNVPGFRKGRAPRHILERVVSAELVREQAVQEIVPESYRLALEEKGVEPFARADFDFDLPERDQPFRFTATVPTQPEITLGDYKEIPVRRREVEIADNDVELELNLMRRRASRVEDVEETAAGPGMLAVVDLMAYRGERLLKGRSREGVILNMDDAESVPAFNVEIEGAAVGETREMTVRYPENYQDAVLAGKEIRYQITLKGLKRVVLPELDEEFAKSLDLESVDEVRARAREQVETAAREVADREVREQVTEYVVAHSEVSFPEVLVDQYVADTLREEREELEKHGATLEEYLQSRGTDMAAHERDLREDARRRLRTQLVLEEVAEKENVTVSDEDVQAELAHTALHANVSPEAMRAMIERQDQASLRNLRVRLLFRKVVDTLMKSARATEA